VSSHAWVTSGSLDSFAGSKFRRDLLDKREEDILETEAKYETESPVIESIMAEAEDALAESTEGAETAGEAESEENSTSDQSTEEAGTEEDATTATESGEEASTEEASEEGSEGDDGPELPKKQAKSYSKELTSHYAQRFGWTDEQVAEDKGKAYAVKKAIDADIFIAEQKERLDALESEQGDEEEEATEEASVATEQSKPTPEQRAEYVERLSRFAKEVNDPEMSLQYAKDWCAFQGVNYEKAVREGFKPEEFVHRQTMYAANLVNTILPRLLPSMMAQVVEQVFPGFGQMYEGALTANTWEDLRSGDKNFKALAAFGTPEFQEAYDATMKENPWIKQILTDDKGNRLSRPQVLATQYRVVAQLLSGQKVTPQTVQTAIEKGKQDANRNNRRVSAGRSLGAGKTTGKINPAPQKPEGGSLGDAYKRHHGDII
jgi:hypothetical protein